MRILQINATLEFGSTGRNAIELQNAIENNKDECYIAYAYCLNSAKKSYKIISKFGMNIHGMLSRIFGLQGYFSIIPTLRLIAYIKKNKFDLINLGNLHSNYICMPLLFNYVLRYNVPLVITLHDCFLYTGRCCHYTADNCFAWQSECHQCPRLKKDNVSYFFDRSKKSFRMRKNFYENCKNLGVIGVSDWITQEAKKSILKNAKIIKRIYNWVDLDVFRVKDVSLLKNQMGLKDKFVILGVASTWSKDKGIEKFIQLSEKISDDFQIILVGNANKNIKCEKIIFVDSVSDVQKLCDYYNLADVFLNLSIEETFGKVTAEALSCGVPAIVPRTTANPELIGENCGYIVYDIIIDDIINLLDKVHNNKKIYYSDSCRKYALEHFDKDKNTKEYINLFCELLNNKDS